MVPGLQLVLSVMLGCLPEHWPFFQRCFKIDLESGMEGSLNSIEVTHLVVHLFLGEVREKVFVKRL